MAPEYSSRPRRRRASRSSTIAPMLTVRRARPGDAAMILALIRGLAAYERLSHEVKASTAQLRQHGFGRRDRKSTRLNSSHRTISYAVFCLKKKKGFESILPPLVMKHHPEAKLVQCRADGHDGNLLA